MHGSASGRKTVTTARRDCSAVGFRDLNSHGPGAAVHGIGNGGRIALAVITFVRVEPAVWILSASAGGAGANDGGEP